MTAEPERTLLGYWRGNATLCGTDDDDSDDISFVAASSSAAAAIASSSIVSKDGIAEVEKWAKLDALEEPIPKENLPFIEGADDEEEEEDDDVDALIAGTGLDPDLIIQVNHKSPDTTRGAWVRALA